MKNNTKMPQKLCLVTLGCPKNIVEGESIAGLLESKGWSLTTDLLSADAAVIHTCSFIADAKNESEDTIRAILRLKKSGRLKRVAVTGCLVQREGKALKDRFKGVDVFAGTGADAIEMLPSALNDGNAELITKPGGYLESSAPRLLSSDLPSAYLRIAEGCNHKCGFCIIPAIRGKFHSREQNAILEEARGLVGCGVKEIILIAQDTTLYGKDIYGKPALAALMKKIAKIDGVKWLRLMYAYPATISPGLIDVIRTEDNICKYIDMPVQHVSDNVLKLMGRPCGVKKIIKNLKERVPGLSLRTSIITGFPGETAKDFKELCSFVSEGWFDQLGVFEYDPVAGTPAASYKGKISSRLKSERKKQLMLIQKRVLRKKFKAMTGTIVEALVESNISENVYAGRTSLQAPEIDGGIIVKGKCSSGEFVKVKITGHRGYDLVGEKA